MTYCAQWARTSPTSRANWRSAMSKKFLALFLLFCASAFGVDTLTVTATGGQFSKIEWNWTADSSGNAIGATSDVVPGLLYSATTTPDTVAVPTDNYDAVIYNQFPAVSGADNVLTTDLAAGTLANRDNVNKELVEIWPSYLKQVSGKIRIQISNAGNAKKGRIVLIIYRTLALINDGGCDAGTFGVPLGGTLGQILQNCANGQAKWVTVSGDATIDDTGLFTLASTVPKLNLNETITGNWVNTTHPWEDADVDDDQTIASTKAGSFTGDLTLGSNAGGQRAAFINAAANTNRFLGFQSAGVGRWYLLTNSSTESGSNTGSPFMIRALTDAGAVIDDPITIIRASGGDIDVTRRIDSSVATGTAPFNVASTTVVPNLNVSQLLGGTWASPGAAIGSGTPGAVTGTTITSTGNFNSSVSSQVFFYHTPASGAANMRFSPLPADTSSTADIDFFRQTNTSATVAFNIRKGDNSSTSIFTMNAGAAPTTQFKNASGTAMLIITHGSVVTYADVMDMAFGTTTGTKIGTATTQKIGLWNATPVVQPSTTGTSTGFTAGAGTAVRDDSTFTGGTGSKAYRISDVVLALKQAGIMAAS